MDDVKDGSDEETMLRIFGRGQFRQLVAFFLLFLKIGTNYSDGVSKVRVNDLRCGVRVLFTVGHGGIHIFLPDLGHGAARLFETLLYWFNLAVNDSLWDGDRVDFCHVTLVRSSLVFGHALAKLYKLEGGITWLFSADFFVVSLS